MTDIAQLKRAVARAFAHCGPPAHDDLVIAEPLRLARGRLHEATGDSSDIFALVAASRLTGPVVWAGLRQDVECLVPGGVQPFIDPARLILVHGNTRQDVLWAAEQAMRAPGAGCVVCELQAGPDLTESRRLQIACGETGCLGLVLISGRAATSAAETRWHCTAAHGHDLAWRWKMVKNRKGRLEAWDITWIMQDDAPGLVHLAAAVAA